MEQYENVCLNFDVSLYGQMEQVSDTLSKCRVRIFYKGLNRNRTYISDDFAQQLINSLAYAPIKGIFDSDSVDFEDHGEDNTDGRIYGIIPESHNFDWEKHLDKDGVEREYATADVILFTGLYPEAKLIPDKPQSMEIYKKTFTGEWRIHPDDNRPYFHFISGSLVGLQTLGDDVEPCFEGAAFFSLYKELKDCLSYIKQTNNNNNNKEGEKMDKTLFRISDNEKADILFDLINPNFNEEGNWELNGFITDVYEDYALYVNKTGYHRVYYTKDGDNVVLGDTVDVKIADVTASEYQALEAMKAIGTYEEVNNNYAEMKASVETLTSEKATLETEKTDFESKISELEAEKENFEKTISEKNEKIGEYENQITEISAEKVRLENEKNDITIEKENLEAFKANVEIEQKNAIIDEFSAHLTDEQISTFKENMGNYTVLDFKKEVCTAAYDSNPTIFSQQENTLLFKGGNPDGVIESGAIKILNKYRNGGNK